MQAKSNKRFQRRASALVILGVLTALAGLALIVSQPSPAGSLASVGVVDRTVEISPDGGDGFREARGGDSLEEGSHVRTDESGFAELSYADGSVSRIGPDTEYQLTRLRTDQNSRDIVGSLKVGQTFHRVSKVTGSGSRFEVQTSKAVAAVRGTEFAVQCVIADICEVGVVEGRVAVLTPDGKTVEVPAGRKVVVDGSGDLSELLFISQSDPWIERNKELDSAPAPSSEESTEVAAAPIERAEPIPDEDDADDGSTTSAATTTTPTSGPPLGGSSDEPSGDDAPSGVPSQQLQQEEASSTTAGPTTTPGETTSTTSRQSSTTEPTTTSTTASPTTSTTTPARNNSQDESSGQTQPCPSGEQRNQFGECVCPAGEERFGGGCRPSCASDAEHVGNDCKPKCGAGEARDAADQCYLVCEGDQEEYEGSCVPKCGDDQKRVDGECEPDCDLDPQPAECDPECGFGETLVDGECEPDCDLDPQPAECDPECGSGETLVDGECEPDCDLDPQPAECDPECGSGETFVDGECEPDCDLDPQPAGCEPECDEPRQGFAGLLDDDDDDCEEPCELQEDERGCNPCPEGSGGNNGNGNGCGPCKDKDKNGKGKKDCNDPEQSCSSIPDDPNCEETQPASYSSPATPAKTDSGVGTGMLFALLLLAAALPGFSRRSWRG